MPWLGESDRELLQMASEMVDERTALRVEVYRRNDWRDRVALRKLDSLLLEALRELGVGPIARSRGTLGEVSEVIARRAELHVLRGDNTVATKDVFPEDGS